MLKIDVETGRKPTYGPRTIHKIHRQIQMNLFVSSSAISANLQDLHLPGPSPATVRRILCNDLQLRGRRPAKKPLLTAEQQARRLNFALAHENWSEEDWCCVLFSDESVVEQYGAIHRSVRRPVGYRYDQRYTTATVKHPFRLWFGVASV